MNFTAPEVVGANKLVPLLNNTTVSQVFLDNAASTKPFKAVSEFIAEIEPYYSNIHRGTGFDSAFCTERYEEARRIVGDFVGWDKELDVVVPVRNTTEGFNILANTIQFEPGDRIITTISEHHSNDLPWRGKAKVEYLPLCSSAGALLTELKKLLDTPGRVRVVSITGASNVTGYINPIHDIALIARQYKALVVVDGAQLIPHRSFEMLPHEDPRHIDFVVFSGHKMNCPFGVGAIVGRKDIFNAAPPYQSGGGTVYSVSLDRVMWAEAPDKQEAGTPNILGLLALAKAIKVVEAVEMDKIAAHEQHLTTLMFDGLSAIPGVEILGKDTNVKDRVGVATFTIPGMHHALIGAILSYEWGIAVRHGCFCAHPLIKHLLNVSPEVESHFEAEILEGRRSTVPGAVRASLGIHNTEADVARLVEAVGCIARQEWQGDYHQEISSGEFLPQNFEFNFDDLPSFTEPQKVVPISKKRAKKRSRQPAVAASMLLLFLASVSSLAWWSNRDKKPTSASAEPEIEPTIARKFVLSQLQPIESDRSFTGTTKATNSVTLTSRVQGEIQQLTVQEGDRVEAGQTIALIDVEDIQAQQSQDLADIAQSQVGVTVAENAATVARSQQLQSQAQLRQAQARLLETEAELADAQLDRQRMSSLKADGAVTQSELDEANTRLSIAKAKVNSTKAEIEEYRAKVSVAETQVEQARSQIEQAKTEVKQTEAKVAQTAANLNYGVVKAPFAGIVTTKHTDMGAIAGTGAPIVTIEGDRNLEFVAKLPVSLADRVQLGKEIDVYLNNLDAVKGEISQIVAAANPNTRNITVKIALKPNPQIISGMFGKIKLTTSDRTAVTIPQSSLVKQMGLVGVYQKTDNGIQFQSVTTGVEQDRYVEIVNGLAPDAKVVLNASN